jgi:hypothetical protein
VEADAVAIPVKRPQLVTACVAIPAGLLAGCGMLAFGGRPWVALLVAAAAGAGTHRLLKGLLVAPAQESDDKPLRFDIDLDEADRLRDRSLRGVPPRGF